MLTSNVSTCTKSFVTCSFNDHDVRLVVAFPFLDSQKRQNTVFVYRKSSFIQKPALKLSLLSYRDCMSSYICGLKSVKRGLCTKIQPNIFRTGEPDRSFTMSNYTSVKNERKRKNLCSVCFFSTCSSKFLECYRTDEHYFFFCYFL